MQNDSYLRAGDTSLGSRRDRYPRLRSEIHKQEKNDPLNGTMRTGQDAQSEL